MSNEWDAFISYSRAATRAEAEALQAKIQTFAKPWNRLRSTRIFRDDASMSANAGLWPTIERALIQARYLILILSPSAATSEWVNNEVQWWLNHKGQDTILLVHADGHLAWEHDAGFSAATDCVPPALRAGLSIEPRWIDLTWFHQPNSTGTADPRFQEIVADLAAPIRGIERDELIGEHVNQLRHTRRLSRIAITALSVLLALALIFAGVAFTQMKIAQEQTRLATVRLLTSESQRLTDQNVGRARLFAAQAFSMADDEQTRRTLFSTLAAGEHLVGELYYPDQPTALATNVDAGVIVLADTHGEVSRWNVNDRAVETLGTPCDIVDDLEASADASVIVGWCRGGEAFAYVNGELFALGQASKVAVSPSGKTIALMEGNTVAIADASPAGVVARGSHQVSGLPIRIALRDDRTLSWISQEPPYAAVYDIESRQLIRRVEYPGMAPEFKRIRSRTGEAFFDATNVWPLSAASEPTSGPLAIDPERAYLADFTAAALSDRGDLFAVALTDGSIQVTTPARAASEVKVRALLEAGANIGPLAITGTQQVIAAHDGVVSVWDLNKSGGVVTRNGLPSELSSLGGNDIFPNHPGTYIAYADYSLSVFSREGKLVWAGESNKGSSFLGWRDDSQFFRLTGGTVTLISVPDGSTVESWSVGADNSASGAWDGEARLLRFADASSLFTLDPESGAIQKTALDGRKVTGFSSDGSQVIIQVGETSTVWDSQLKSQFYETSDGSLQFTSDGNVTVQRNSGKEFVSLDGGATMPLTGNVMGFSRFPISPDGSTYLTAAIPGYATLMFRETGNELGRVPIQLFQDDTYGTWADAAFSGDGNSVFIIAWAPDSSYATQLTVIDLRPTSMMNAVCETVRRGLEPTEWTTLTGQPAPTDLACQTAETRTDVPMKSPSVATPAPNSTGDQPPNTKKVSGWITVLDSAAKANSDGYRAAADLAATLSANSQAQVDVIDTDAHPGLTAGYWAVVISGSSTEDEARAACARVGREPGPDCYPKHIG